jgi:hypothetical protein
MKITPLLAKNLSSNLLIFGAGLVLILSALLPVVIDRSASAQQLNSRSLSISTGLPGQTGVTYTYGFTTQTSAAIQTIEFIMCDSAVGTYDPTGASCTAPTGCGGGGSNCVNAGTEASRSGWSQVTAFTRSGTGGGDCTPGNNVLCLTRTQGGSETAGARTLGWNTQINPTGTNTAFFVGIYLYSDTGWSTDVDSGTVASATTQSTALAVNAAVAEILNFCVGATATNDATSSVAGDCTGVSGTNVNIGTLDTSTVNISPINTNGGDNENGVAMIRTNAVNGAAVSYRAVQQTGTNHQGTLRFASANCDVGATNTDQCINAAGTTQAAFTAGTENFGMTVGGVNCGSVSVSSYSCTYASGTNHLQQDPQYIGGADDQTYGASAAKGFAWDESGSFDTVASSSGVIDDEALILRFAATPSITTPFGAYAAQADFVAVATY